MGNVFPAIEKQSIDEISFFIFQALLCSIVLSIVNGAISERVNFFGYILTSILVTCLLYPIFGHWVSRNIFSNNNGWLQQLGFIDLGGATAIHSLSGWVALACLKCIGPRQGRFNADGHPTHIGNSNLPLASLGVIFLWVGWIGLNSGQSEFSSLNIAQLFLNLSISGSAGMVTALFIGFFTQFKIKVDFIIHGSIAGLVSISGLCHACPSTSALLIGIIGSSLMIMMKYAIENIFIDDSIGAIPAHLAPGIWGTLAIPIFGNLDTLGSSLSQGHQLTVQCVGILSCAAWSYFTTYIILKIILFFHPIRVSQKIEDIGLNFSESHIKSEWINLLNTMELQAKTGDLNLRAQVDPFSEIGKIAEKYNDVMNTLSKLKKEVIKKEMEKKEQGELTVEAMSSAKLASIGELAAGVAHEINNPLNGMINYTQLVMDQLNGEQQNILNEAIEEGKRISSIVANLLEYSRQKEEALSIIQIETTITNSLNLMESQFKKDGIHLYQEIDNDLPPVKARKGELQQVWINLLSNAKHALNEKFPNFNKDKSIFIHVSFLKEQQLLSIDFKDNGVGISKENLNKIFTPFFTTKSSGQGTGLGLPICQKILAKYQSKLKIQDSEGQGCHIQIKFPIYSNG